MGETIATQANIQVAGAKMPPPPVIQTNTEEVTQVSGKISAERADAPTSLSFAGKSAAPLEFTPEQAAFANNAWLSATNAQLA